MLPEQPSSLPLMLVGGAPVLPPLPGRSSQGDGSTDSAFADELKAVLQAAPPLPGSPRMAVGDESGPPRRELSSEEASQIKETAAELESLLLYQLLKQMWASIPESSLMPAGNAGQIYREMWLERVAEEASSAGGGIGIARVVEAQLTEQAQRSFTPEQAAQLR